jgi:hypothetical protein
MRPLAAGRWRGVRLHLSVSLSAGNCRGEVRWLKASAGHRRVRQVHACSWAWAVVSIGWLANSVEVPVDLGDLLTGCTTDLRTAGGFAGKLTLLP